MQVFNFFRSGASHRLRIALELKGLAYEYIAVDLRREEQFTAAFRAMNPQGFVPVLKDGDSVLLQSPAILEWLEERYPTPALLPADPLSRQRVRALAAIVGCDIHPLNNRRILEYLRHTLQCEQDAVTAWCRHWIDAGFDAYEALLGQSAPHGDYSFGDTPTLADVYLIPQIASARRFGVALDRYQKILAIEGRCLALPAFARAAPSRQPDAD